MKVGRVPTLNAGVEPDRTLRLHEAEQGNRTMKPLKMLTTLLLLAALPAVDVRAEAAATPAATDSVAKAGVCLTDHTTGRDRKELVKWMFLAMSKHPEIKALSASNSDDDARSNKIVGALFTRLMSEDCADEISQMLAEHGPGSISKAFEMLGAMAMSELMTDAQVSAAFGELNKYTDQAKISAAIQGEGKQP